MMLREKMIPCHSCEAVVTIQSYHNGIADGYLQHPRLDKRKRINSLTHLMLLLNDLLALEDCPNKPLPFVSSTYSGEDGGAVFRIQILFQEYHSWQGKLVWQNENQEAVFRSGIELLQLLDEILAE